MPGVATGDDMPRKTARGDDNASRDDAEDGEDGEDGAVFLEEEAVSAWCDRADSGCLGRCVLGGSSLPADFPDGGYLPAYYRCRVYGYRYYCCFPGASYLLPGDCCHDCYYLRLGVGSLAHRFRDEFLRGGFLHRGHSPRDGYANPMHHRGAIATACWAPMRQISRRAPHVRASGPRPLARQS